MRLTHHRSTRSHNESRLVRTIRKQISWKMKSWRRSWKKRNDMERKRENCYISYTRIIKICWRNMLKQRIPLINYVFNRRWPVTTRRRRTSLEWGVLETVIHPASLFCLEYIARCTTNETERRYSSSQWSLSFHDCHSALVDSTRHFNDNDDADCEK